MSLGKRKENHFLGRTGLNKTCSLRPWRLKAKKSKTENWVLDFVGFRKINEGGSFEE